MARDVERVKAMAPTRPHSMTPNEGVVRTVAGSRSSPEPAPTLTPSTDTPSSTVPPRDSSSARSARHTSTGSSCACSGIRIAARTS